MGGSSKLQSQTSTRLSASLVRDVTTLNMHHVCVSISFFLVDNESYKPPADGQETHGVELLVQKTPRKRKVTTINSLLVEEHTPGGHNSGQRILTWTLTVASPSKATPFEKDIHAFLDMETPLHPPPEARCSSTHMIYSCDEPKKEVREFQSESYRPAFPRTGAEFRLAGLRELQTVSPVAWVDFNSAGEKYKVETTDGEVWHRMAALGYRTSAATSEG